LFFEPFGTEQVTMIRSARAKFLCFCLLLVGFLLVAFLPPAGEARSCRPSLIPNGFRFNCSNCHLSSNGGGPRNAFGEEVRRRINNSSSCLVRFWGPALAALDSDGDGRTNGMELQDPEGLWMPGDPSPGSLALVTNPGVFNSFPVEKVFLRGDANADGEIDVSDAVLALLALFGSGASLPCREAANANGDAALDVSDAVWLLRFLFQGGPPPAAPFPGCALGVVRVGCDSIPPCS
jgi:hypothetical protein